MAEPRPLLPWRKSRGCRADSGYLIGSRSPAHRNCFCRSQTMSSATNSSISSSASSFVRRFLPDRRAVFGLNTPLTHSINPMSGTPPGFIVDPDSCSTLQALNTNGSPGSPDEGKLRSHVGPLAAASGTGHPYAGFIHRHPPCSRKWGPPYSPHTGECPFLSPADLFGTADSTSDLRMKGKTRAAWMVKVIR